MLLRVYLQFFLFPVFLVVWLEKFVQLCSRNFPLQCFKFAILLKMRLIIWYGSSPPVWRRCQRRHPECIQFNAMDVHYGHVRECKGVGIPSQHHLRLLPGPSGACASSIRHDNERDDMQCPTRVSPWTPSMEYCLWQHPKGGCPTRSKCHLLCW